MPIHKKKDFIKIRKQRKSVYQSDQVPEHFENEGGEYIDVTPNWKNTPEDTEGEANYDKMKGTQSVTKESTDQNTTDKRNAGK